MAMRFTSASNQMITATTSLPAITAVTICGWCRLISAVAWANIVILADSVPNSYIQLEMDSAGTGVFIATSNGGGSSSSNIATPGTGVDFFWAITCSGTGANAVTGYYAAATATSLSSITSTTNSFTPNTLDIGSDYYSESIDARIWNVKVWDATLTSTELLREKMQARPARTLNLNRWIPMIRGSVAEDVKDFSGNGRNMTAVNTPTIESNLVTAWEI